MINDNIDIKKPLATILKSLKKEYLTIKELALSLQVDEVSIRNRINKNIKNAKNIIDYFIKDNTGYYCKDDVISYLVQEYNYKEKK